MTSPSISFGLLKEAPGKIQRTVEQWMERLKTPNIDKRLETMSQNGLQEVLFQACSKGDLDTVKQILLLDVLEKVEIDVNQKSSNRMTPLHLACENNHIEIMKLLIEYGAFINEVDKWKNTPLHIAVNKGFKDAVLLLLGNGAVVNVRDRFGSSPLHLSVKSHQFEIARLLVLFGADINFKRNGSQHRGFTCLHEAMHRGDVEAVKFLIDLSEHEHVLFHIKDEFGDPPLFKAIAGRHIECIKLLLQHKKETSSLLIHNHRKQNIYHIIASTGSLMIYTLISLSIPQKLEETLVSETDLNGRTPLHYAVESNSLSLIQQMVEVGASLDIQDSRGDTALHIAARKQLTQLAYFLVLKGANPELKNRRKETPNKLMKSSKRSLQFISNE